MSSIPVDCAVSVVPEDMNFLPSKESSDSALRLFRELFPYAEEYAAESFEQVQFISPELFAFAVACPNCGLATERGSLRDTPGRIWFSGIDDSSNQCIEKTETALPACGHVVPFTSLRFDSPAGFAKFVLKARFKFFDERLMNDEMQESDEIKRLSLLLGVPLRFVKTFYAVLPQDRKAIEGLFSSSERERAEAVIYLDSLDQGHFEEHSISKIFIEDKAEKLLAAFVDTNLLDAKRWIISLLAEAQFVSDTLIEIVTVEFGRTDELLEPFLYLIYRCPVHFQHLKSKIKLLHLHSEAKIRWRCAMALKSLRLEYNDDRDVLRALLLDDFYATRLEAFFAFNNMIGDDTLVEADRGVLMELIDKDAAGAAAYYAKELLERQ